jgi:hypothetical protein
MECLLHLTLGFELARLLFAPAENNTLFVLVEIGVVTGVAQNGTWLVGTGLLLLIPGCRRGVFEVFILLLCGDLGRWLHGIRIGRDGFCSSIPAILATVTT